MSQSEHRASGDLTCKIRAHLRRKGLTVTALSTATGIARSTLQKKLNGKGDLTVAELVAIAIALDVPAADLISGVDGAGDGTQR